MQNPAIVVITYNRLSSLKRIIGNLQLADYSRCSGDVTLVISIDGGGDAAIHDYANEVEWENGKIRIINHENNLGLKEHVLSCGDLTEEYDSVIILEDDVIVSSEFYNYSTYSLEAYAGDKSVAGISLYNPKINLTSGTAFEPLDFGHDFVKIQYAQSWGQVWCRDQWVKFRGWYKEWAGKLKTLSEANIDLPNTILSWPASSWLKYKCAYLIDSNLYYIYPVGLSYSTNFGDVGTHFAKENNIYQVALSNCNPHQLNKPTKALIRYDSYFELNLDSLPQCVPLPLDDFQADSITLDLHGVRKIEKLKSEDLVLTIRPVRRALKTFGLKLKSREQNLLMNTKGSELKLAYVKDVLAFSRIDRMTHSYYYEKKFTTLKEFGKIMLRYLLKYKVFKK